jgi:hypothetical protein
MGCEGRLMIDVDQVPPARDYDKPGALDAFVK